MRVPEPDVWIIPDWPAPPNVRAVVSTRRGPGVSKPPYDAFNLGARCGDEPPVVAENRARLRQALALPSRPHWLRQAHGTGVAVFPAPFTGGEPTRSADALNGIGRDSERAQRDARAWQRASAASMGGGNNKKASQEPEADAALTRTRGVVLAIVTADCLPVVLCARDGTEIAVAHAGWRGLSAGVLENTLAAMRSASENILAWLGPAIGPRSYEVGAEVRDAFLARDRIAAEAFASTRPGHWRCDLYTLARQRLRGAGISQIFGGDFDTHTDVRLYSYRHQGARSGRFATLVWLDPGTE